MFTRLLLLFTSVAFAACSVEGPREPLAVHTEDGFLELVAPPTAEAPIVVPTVSRSEVVVRAHLTRRGLGLRTAGAPVHVEAIAHRPDQQVIYTEDRGALIAGPPVLPSRVKAAHGDLAHLARRDGVGLRGGELEIFPPLAQPALSGPGERELVLIGDAATGTWALPTSNAPLFASHPEEILIDQAFYAELTPPEPVALTAEPLEAGSDESWFAVPALEQGLVWTFLIRSENPQGRDARSAIAHAAPGNAGAFADVAVSAGISMVHLEGPDEQLDIRPTMGPGAAWGDIDGDGWVDLYLVQGGGRAGSAPLPNRLFRNLGDGTFAEVPSAGGAADAGAGMGALFFDGDGDGDLDLYVANYGEDKLYENDGTGAFADASQRAGLVLDLWSAGVAAADYDGDGDLDLYVTSYLDYDVEKMPPADELGRYQREDPIEMLPFAFPGQRNVMLRNEGRLAFTDVTEELGLLDVQGRGMQPIFWDFDRDGDQDLYVANDVSFNVLFRNEGDGTFKDISFSTGLDDPRGGMGLAVGDVDGDTDEDVFLTNWQLEANALYLNNLVPLPGSKHRQSTFFDGTVRSNLGPPGIGATSWSCVLFDLDNDTDLDLFVANGYTSPDYASTGICVGQPNHLFLGRGDGRFDGAGTAAGPALARKLASRAAAACDFDQDGRMDLVVTANNGPVQLLSNRTQAAGHWLIVRLRGANGNTFAVGAEVAIEAGGKTLVRSLRAGNGYLSGDAPELHFGLGDAAGPVIARVRWPSGAENEYPIETLDRVVELRE